VTESGKSGGGGKVREELRNVAMKKGLQEWNEGGGSRPATRRKHRMSGSARDWPSGIPKPYLSLFVRERDTKGIKKWKLFQNAI
jgi:hypothetical protein